MNQKPACVMQRSRCLIMHCREDAFSSNQNRWWFPIRPGFLSRTVVVLSEVSRCSQAACVCVQIHVNCDREYRHMCTIVRIHLTLLENRCSLPSCNTVSMTIMEYIGYRAWKLDFVIAKRSQPSSSRNPKRSNFWLNLNCTRFFLIACAKAFLH